MHKALDHIKTNLKPEMPLFFRLLKDRLMFRRNKNITDESSSQEY